MILYVGVTDDQWFHSLAELQPEEVNFWRPSKQGFRALEPWAPFLFKLHSPNNFVVGGGFFVRYMRLPFTLMWDFFGLKNGADNRDNLLRLIRRHSPSNDYYSEVGCIILAEPFFFEESDWIPIPKDWRPGIQQGKTYDTSDAIGQKLWEDVQIRLASYSHVEPDFEIEPFFDEITPRYGKDYPAKQRLGQGAFRAVVLDAYKRRCAVTAERTLPTLEAIHIKPYALQGPHDVRNGMLLRADLHRLFESGYITITPDLRIEVSSKIREHYENGREYYAFQGKQLAVIPARDYERPSHHFLDWHNSEIFRS